MVCRARCQTAPVKRPVGVFLRIAVKADLVLALVPFGDKVKIHFIRLPGFQGCAGVNIEFRFPDTPVGRRGRGLVDVHCDAVGSFVHPYEVTVVMAFEYAVGTAVGKRRKRNIGKRNRDQFFVCANCDVLIQSKCAGKHVVVMIADLLDAEVADLHGRSLRSLTEGKLHHQVFTGTGSGNDSFAVRYLAGSHILPVKGAVTFLDFSIVEENFERHILIACHIDSEVITDTGLGEQAGFYVEPGLPHAGFP